MTRWWIPLAYFRGMTVSANKVAVFINPAKLRTDILPQPFTIVTFGARSNRHIRLQASQRRRLRNVDMTTGAFQHVRKLWPTTVMLEFPGDALWSFRRRQLRLRQLVTAGTVRRHWLFIFPMTVEA